MVSLSLLLKTKADNAYRSFDGVEYTERKAKQRRTTGVMRTVRTGRL